MNNLTDYNNLSFEEALIWQRSTKAPENGLNLDSRGWINRNILINKCLNKYTLDVACGNGLCIDNGRPNERKLSSDLYHGIDISPTLIEAARHLYPNYNFDVGSCFELPYSNNTFDVAMACGLLEHLPDFNSVKKTVSEMLRVSKEGVYLSWHHQPIKGNETIRVIKNTFYGADSFSNKYNIDKFNEIYPIDRIVKFGDTPTSSIWYLSK
jgi:ubiquinone/menaquinone biosynthesis C-methylase UbiE